MPSLSGATPIDRSLSPQVPLSARLSAGNHGTPAQNPRLAHAAHEFEAQLMKELLKPVTAGAGLPGDDDEEGSAGALGAFAGEALANAISQAGGFGIADRLIQQLSRSGTRSDSDWIAGNQHLDTGQKALR